MDMRPFTQTIARLKAVGLRPTRQRIGLARILFDKGDRHVTAETLHEEAGRAGLRVSLATVYNTLNQFTGAGLLREVVVDTARSYFDTNVTGHHHFFNENSASLLDIPSESIAISNLPEPPAGMKVSRVDVVVRLSKN